MLCTSGSCHEFSCLVNSLYGMDFLLQRMDVGGSFPHPGHLQQTCVVELLHEALSLAVAPARLCGLLPSQPHVVPGEWQLLSLPLTSHAHLSLPALGTCGSVACWQQAWSCRAHEHGDAFHQPLSVCDLWKAERPALSALQNLAWEYRPHLLWSLSAGCGADTQGHGTKTHMS